MAYNLFKAALAEATGKPYSPNPDGNKREEVLDGLEKMGIKARPATTLVKTYKSEKDRDRGIDDMTRKGYEIQSINGQKGDYKAVKGVAMAAIGAVLFGPLGILAGGLAGRKKQDWVIVYTK